MSNRRICSQIFSTCRDEAVSWPASPPSTSCLFLCLLQEDRTFISRDCTQSCVCTEGSIQCLVFQCPPGTYCRDSGDGGGTCVKISKGAMGEDGEAVLLAGGTRGRASRSLVPWWALEVGDGRYHSRETVGAMGRLSLFSLLFSRMDLWGPAPYFIYSWIGQQGMLGECLLKE